MLVRDKLHDMVEKNSGYLLTSDVVDAGISKTYMAQFVKENMLERVAHGVYLSRDAVKDEYYILYLKNQKIIFSHETALYLQDMTDVKPAAISVTVRAGYNATHLREQGIRVYQVKPSSFDMGIKKVKTNMGHEVPVYDRERTVCDIAKYHDDMDLHVFQAAMREYMSKENKDLNRLLAYAVLLGVGDRMKNYVEVLA